MEKGGGRLRDARNRAAAAVPEHDGVLGRRRRKGIDEDVGGEADVAWSGQHARLDQQQPAVDPGLTGALRQLPRRERNDIQRDVGRLGQRG